MQQTISYIWCDVCRVKGAKIPGAPANVAIGDLVLLEVDLCEKHQRALARAVRKVLPKLRDRRGRDRHRNDRSQGPFRCQVRGCDVHPLKHRSSFTQHLRIYHELTLAQYVMEYGELVPMTTEEQRTLVVTASCDECDQEYSTATGTRWPHQALVSHMRGRHALKLFPDGRKEPIA